MEIEYDLDKWHQDEENWWNKNGDYMSYQWKLTPFLNKILREDLENDYEKFLLMPNKKMLDVGCGSGWLSTYFADRGMKVVGIDVSKEQIEAAEKLKLSKNNLDFICCDLVKWQCEALKEEFDVVFVNAFLHHLPLVELEMVFNKIEYVLKTGGRVYLYEPLEYSGSKENSVKLIDYITRGVIHILMHIVPKMFNLYNERHKKEINEGYTMASPHERPINIENITNIVSKSFDVKEIRAWHIYTMGCSMQSMGFKKNALLVYSYFIKVLSSFENRLIKTFGWHSFSRPGRFILCSIKLVKK